MKVFKTKNQTNHFPWFWSTWLKTHHDKFSNSRPSTSRVLANYKQSNSFSKWTPHSRLRPVCDYCWRVTDVGEDWSGWSGRRATFPVVVRAPVGAAGATAILSSARLSPASGLLLWKSKETNPERIQGI